MFGTVYRQVTTQCMSYIVKFINSKQQHSKSVSARVYIQKTSCNQAAACQQHCCIHERCFLFVIQQGLLIPVPRFVTMNTYWVTMMNFAFFSALLFHYLGVEKVF